MLIGVPREIKKDEHRVGLTPASVHELVVHGHDVIVETDAGTSIGFGDDIYREVGAQIGATAQEVFKRADMIVKEHGGYRAGNRGIEGMSQPIPGDGTKYAETDGITEHAF